MSSTKNVWILLFCCLCALPSFAKDDKPPFVWEKISTVDLTQKEIIAQANAFIAEKFVSGKRVIELSDPELGKLVGTVILMNPDAKMLNPFHGIHARLILEAKDGRYRLQMANIVAVDSKGLKANWGEIESANNYRIQPMADKVLADFSTELNAYLSNAKKASEW